MLKVKRSKALLFNILCRYIPAVLVQVSWNPNCKKIHKNCEDLWLCCIKSFVKLSGDLELRYAKENLKAIEQVCCAGTSKIFDNSLCKNCCFCPFSIYRLIFEIDLTKAIRLFCSFCLWKPAENRVFILEAFRLTLFKRIRQK